MLDHYIAFRVETCPVEELHGPCAPEKVLAIGYEDQAGRRWTEDVGLFEEAEILRHFWEYAACGSRDWVPMIGYGICRFSLPLLVRRSWILGVEIPRNGILKGYSMWDRETFIDLLEVWRLGQQLSDCGLVGLAEVFGFRPKTKSDKDFAELWKEDCVTANRTLEERVGLISCLAKRMLT